VNQSAFITAAEVGEFVYCEEAWRLSRTAPAAIERLSPPDTEAMRKGRAAHESWNPSEQSSARFLKPLFFAVAGLLLVALLAALLT
jgi:hypothetical protein